VTGDPLDKYVCHVCGLAFELPSWARDHEIRHEVK
jgi:hypothetical protein